MQKNDLSLVFTQLTVIPGNDILKVSLRIEKTTVCPLHYIKLGAIFYEQEV